MANLMITTACNFKCDYCFGKEMINTKRPYQTMEWKLFMNILEWIDRVNMPRMSIHLMGGEPSLSPLFGDMIGELAPRKRDIVIFSNAAAPVEGKTLKDSVRLGARWIVNCNPPSTYPENQLKNLHNHLSILGEAACLSFNIVSPSTEFDYLFDYIEEFKLNPIIKIGVALPTLGHKNVYAKQDDFPRIAARIMELYERAQRSGVNIQFECGVPYCLFTPVQHERLEDIMVSHCHSRLDITPIGNVINCLPLCSVAAIPYSCFSSYSQAQEWFHKAFFPYSSLGITSKCLKCEDLAEGRCQACLAHILGNLNRIVLPPLPGSERRTTIRLNALSPE
ncbi:MAG: radical SAM protein [Candidatus Aminicenantaceae bacterium]